jgi:hypothetical protein
LNLAAGRTETWIADRTGHKSSDMINRYRHVARTAAELGLGGLAPAAVSMAAVGGAANPRTVLLEQLTAGMSAAIAVGDLEVARIAHEAIGRLLGLAPAASAAPVVDLAAERARRT